MFPPRFDYRRPESVDEALALLSDHGAHPVAGGQGLVQDLKLGDADPDLLVDVAGLDALAGLADRGDALAVGALTTHADLASDDAVAERAPVLRATARELGDRQVRNRGTVGGNLAEADPAADLPAAVLAADATLDLLGPDGERTVPAGEFVAGPGETTLAGDELVTTVEVPAHDAGAYAKKTHPASGYAMVGVAAVIDVADGVLDRVGVAVTGATERPVRLGPVEEALAGRPVADLRADRQAGGDGAPGDDDVAAAAARAGVGVDPDSLRGDVHASRAFRAELLEPYTERALEAALAQVGGEAA